MNRKNFLKSLFCLPALTLAKDEPKEDLSLAPKEELIIMHDGSCNNIEYYYKTSFVLDINGNLGIGATTSSNFLKINENQSF